MIRGSCIDENRCAVGTENKDGIAAAVGQMMNIERSWLPGFED